MKKVSKYLLLLSSSIVSLFIYKKYTDEKQRQLCELSLKNAKDHVGTGEKVIGSWINMTPEQNATDFIYRGGVTTDKYTYDFTAEATTGNILTFEQQIRI